MTHLNLFVAKILKNASRNSLNVQKSKSSWNLINNKFIKNCMKSNTAGFIRKFLAGD